MKKISAIARLMRLPNLLIIILTQTILRYGLIKPFLFSGNTVLMSGWLDFSLLVLCTALIAVGGYIMNDCFDAGIDAVNKPGKNVVGKEIPEKSAIFIYRVISGIAVLTGFYLAFRLKSITAGILFPFIIYLLWMYNAKYKKVFVWGNLIISFLSAMVIFMVWYFEFLHMRLIPDLFATVLPNLKNVNVFFVIYAAFAFLVTFFREIIKDIEDFKGDSEFGCKTIPIVYGVKNARFIASGIILITIILTLWFQGILANRGWSAVLWYVVAVIQIPMAYIILKLVSTRKEPDYHFLSSICKIIMVAGILSVQLIYSSL